MTVRTSGARALARALAALAAVLAPAAACRNFTTPAPSLSISPPSLRFTGPADGQNPPAQALSVGLAGTGAVTYGVSFDVTWLHVYQDSGTAPGTAFVVVNTWGLTAGTYLATVTVAAAGDATGRWTVPVTLVLGPALSLSGRWVGLSDRVNLTLTLADSGGLVTGAGTVSSISGRLRVSGTHLGPSVALTLTAGDGTTMGFAGSLVSDNAISGILGGGGGGAGAGDQLVLSRQ